MGGSDGKMFGLRLWCVMTSGQIFSHPTRPNLVLKEVNWTVVVNDTNNNNRQHFIYTPGNGQLSTAIKIN